MDVRTGKSHWDFPGPDGKFGYSGKCFPKDTNHFASMANSPFLDEILKYQTK
jgi:UDPglucose 6-dehydrogenase